MSTRPISAADSMPSQIDDQQLSQTGALIQRYKDGDPKSLNELLQHHYPLVQRIVRARMGKRLGLYYDDEDFIQNTFLAAVRSIESIELRDSASFRGWLAKITERQILGAFRYHTSDKNDWDLEAGQPDIGGASTAPSPLDAAVGRGEAPSQSAREKEHQMLIDRCMGLLPEEEREVILLRHYMEHSWREIAEILGRPSDEAARQLRDRAMKRLNQIVARHRSDLPSGYSDA